MRHIRISALLMALIIFVLAACGNQAELPQDTMPATPAIQDTPAPTPPPESTPTPEPPVTPAPGPDLSWEMDHRLDVDFTPVEAGGLEVPIRGATGYASVELPLWETLPPDRVPTPSPAPAVIPEPAPSPTPTAAPEDSLVPTSSPTPTASPAPTVQDTPIPQATPETTSTPEDVPTPEPTSTPEVTPAPEPGPTPVPGSEPEDLPTPDAETAPADDGSQPEPSPPETPPLSPTETQPQDETPMPTPDPYEGALALLPPGTSFTVLEERGNWWKVESDLGTGWVEHRYCMVNLPDVIPSIIYDAVNAYSSRYVSSGKPLEGVTGKALYAGKVYNPRLGRDEFLMPVLYSMALKICQVQQAALAEGNSLILYEGYRPYTVQRQVNRALTILADTDEEVRAGISDPPWDMSWFIAPGYSNHQRGFAIDVGLAKVWKAGRFYSGQYFYPRPLEYDVYEMPSAIHELSRAAAAFVKPVAINSKTAWKYGELSEGMNEPALALQRYCTDAGLTPLASEWWHFNDLDAQSLVSDNLSTGNFEITRCRSKIS